MNFNDYIDFKSIPFSVYVERLVKMSPLPVEGDGSAEFYFDSRGMKYLGDFDDLYPGNGEYGDFEGTIVLENENGERIAVYDNSTNNRTYSVACNPDDKNSMDVFLNERIREADRIDRELLEYQERCKKQVNGTSSDDDLKEYDVYFNVIGKTRVTATSEDDAKITANKLLNDRYVSRNIENKIYVTGRDHVTDVKYPF